VVEWTRLEVKDTPGIAIVERQREFNSLRMT
jgi:hypothetical protein